MCNEPLLSLFCSEILKLLYFFFGILGNAQEYLHTKFQEESMTLKKGNMVPKSIKQWSLFMMPSCDFDHFLSCVFLGYRVQTITSLRAFYILHTKKVPFLYH